MTGAIALAIVLVVAVAGMSMALQGQQGPLRQGGRPTRPRPSAPPGNARRARDRLAERRAPRQEPPPAPESREPEIKGPELLRSGQSASAKVISVVDERTTGPVTRSRLTLEVKPEGESPFEVTVRFAFPTPEARSRVKVGGTVPVRYDKEDHSKVVVDLPRD